jgi:hypothetical protein
VIYGYLVIDSLQKLTIQAGVQVYLNYKAGIWVYRYGQLKVLGQKGNEVVFQGARREKVFNDDPGQWDRIWINEGSNNNQIDYAIIKNGYIGIQTELLGNVIGLPGKLTLTNTKIQNMSMWGIYGFGYVINGGNNVVTNCHEHLLNVVIGGDYRFVHCTFANFWTKDSRQKPAINVSNYTSSGQTLPVLLYFGNSVIDGKLDNEITLDLKGPDSLKSVTFSSSYLKTTADFAADTLRYLKCRKGASLKYKDVAGYNFEPSASDSIIKGFNNQRARTDVAPYRRDINQKQRNTTAPTAGAYEF